MNTSETLFFHSLLWSGISSKNSESISAFKKQFLKFTRPSPNSTFNEHNPHRIKLLTHYELG